MVLIIQIMMMGTEGKVLSLIADRSFLSRSPACHCGSWSSDLQITQLQATLYEVVSLWRLSKPTKLTGIRAIVFLGIIWLASLLPTQRLKPMILLRVYKTFWQRIDYVGLYRYFTNLPVQCNVESYLLGTRSTLAPLVAWLYNRVLIFFNSPKPPPFSHG